MASTPPITDGGYVFSRLVKAGVIIYGGDFVATDATGNHLAEPCTDSAGLHCIGICWQTVDNSGGADGAESVIIWTGGCATLPVASISYADLDNTVYCKTVKTVTTRADTTNRIGIGTLKGYNPNTLTAKVQMI